MKPLSEQLSDLADRAKQAEDTVAAAQAKNRAALQSQREKLKSSIDAATRRTQADATAAHEEMQSWWDETRSDIHDRFEELRAKRDERCAERDLQRAENRADDAELDAADAIDFAAYTIDEAEYAVVDAGIARADADELKVEQSSDAATALWVSSSPPSCTHPGPGLTGPGPSNSSDVGGVALLGLSRPPRVVENNSRVPRSKVRSAQRRVKTVLTVVHDSATVSTATLISHPVRPRECVEWTFVLLATVRSKNVGSTSCRSCSRVSTVSYGWTIIGYPLALLAMVLLSVGLYLMFRRRKWL
jgi:hypothetical protein